MCWNKRHEIDKLTITKEFLIIVIHFSLYVCLPTQNTSTQLWRTSLTPKTSLSSMWSYHDIREQVHNYAMVFPPINAYLIVFLIHWLPLRLRQWNQSTYSKWVKLCLTASLCYSSLWKNILCSFWCASNIKTSVHPIIITYWSQFFKIWMSIIMSVSVFISVFFPNRFWNLT